jgi:hypothetical protein
MTTDNSVNVNRGNTLGTGQRQVTVTDRRRETEADGTQVETLTFSDGGQHLHITPSAERIRAYLASAAQATPGGSESEQTPLDLTENHKYHRLDVEALRRVATEPPRGIEFRLWDQPTSTDCASLAETFGLIYRLHDNR